jgi:hypothetical protein
LTSNNNPRERRVVEQYVWRQFKEAERAIDESPDPLRKGLVIALQILRTHLSQDSDLPSDLAERYQCLIVDASSAKANCPGVGLISWCLEVT